MRKMGFGSLKTGFRLQMDLTIVKIYFVVLFNSCSQAVILKYKFGEFFL
jgi:hypothetical protein